MKLFLIILFFLKLNLTFSQEKNKTMESGFDELKGLNPIMMGWAPDGWIVEVLKKKTTDQMSLF